MDEVHGGIFIRFAEVLVRCLCFHFSPYVVHAVFLFVLPKFSCVAYAFTFPLKLGTWAVTSFQTRNPGSYQDR